MSLGRKPRIALMGEFSAGKSTLSNLLLGARPLPEKVTATRLSPVWMAQGNETPYRIDVSGEVEGISLANLEEIPVDETRVIRLFFEADILEVCDLIDFPGISDPNMSSDVWQRMLDEVDAVLWCTHATQAWRQSEAAVWESMPEAVRERSVLLITRFDKLTTERDQKRVLARVKKETDGQFGATFPIALLQALEAGDDWEAFNASGAGEFLEHLIKLVQDLHSTVKDMEQTLYQVGQVAPASATADSAETEPEIESPPVFNEAQEDAVDPTPTLAETSQEELLASDAPVVSVDSAEPVVHVEKDDFVMSDESENNSVMPRRIRPTSSGARTPRPQASDRVVDMSTELLTKATRPARPAVDSVGLRSIFSDGETDLDDAASS